MQEIKVSEAKPVLHKLVRAARDGTPIIITQGHERKAAAVLVGWDEYRRLTAREEKGGGDE